MNSRSLHVLTGCTAVGKTEWALRWAEERGAEIISCDSLLFYKGLDIGTAKPSKADLGRVPHHLIDILEVTEAMDVSRYVRLAKSAAEAIASRGRPILVVGGSGFYLKSFFAAVADDVGVPQEIRLGVAQRLESGGLPALVEELGRLNPGGLGSLDTDNPRRVSRALERCLASGKSLSDLAAAFARQPAPFSGWDVTLTRIDRPADALNRRISERVAFMLGSGLIEEVRLRLEKGLKNNPSASRAIGYREVISMLGGQLQPSSLASEIEKNTRALVKKQRTWFRTQLPPHAVVTPSG